VAHRAMGGRERVFDDLLTMAVCALAGGTLEEEYLGVVRGLRGGAAGTERDVDRLAAVFARLVETMEETRADILGDVFQGAIARGRHGQFFTPEHLCELMTRMTDDGSGATVGDPCCGSGRMLWPPRRSIATGSSSARTPTCAASRSRRSTWPAQPLRARHLGQLARQRAQARLQDRLQWRGGDPLLPRRKCRRPPLLRRPRLRRLR